MRLRGAAFSSLAEPAAGLPRRLGRFRCFVRLRRFGHIERGRFGGAVLGALARADSGGVPCNVAYHTGTQVLADQRLVSFGRQAQAGKLGKGAAERRLAGQWAV